jgi:hypothetical protein
MCEMASALASMSLDSWKPLVDSEASEKSCRVAHNAALSRRRHIQDAADYWNPQVDRTSHGGAIRPVRTVTMLTPDWEGPYIIPILGRYDDHWSKRDRRV